MMAQPDLETFAKATMRNLGRDPDDWRAIWNPCREFLAMMQAWQECVALFIGARSKLVVHINPDVFHTRQANQTKAAVNALAGKPLRIKAGESAGEI